MPADIQPVGHKNEIIIISAVQYLYICVKDECMFWLTVTGSEKNIILCTMYKKTLVHQKSLASL